MFQDLPLDCCCSAGSTSLPPMQVEAEKDHQQYGIVLESARVLGDHQQCGCISALVQGDQCGCIDDSVKVMIQPLFTLITRVRPTLQQITTSLPGKWMATIHMHTGTMLFFVNT